jgi:hypothetical protein
VPQGIAAVTCITYKVCINWEFRSCFYHHLNLKCGFNFAFYSVCLEFYPLFHWGSIIGGGCSKEVQGIICVPYT